ncbi:hypothetical protein O181_014082 [Austropuccinia psidii MF-1]|uniref:Uncharacterized protein n=1 Tax=Austropuccinia psidii MF-1 TaxID=1389203 RepID=A0A9Q3BZI8_9BASI|nr:hypothetical protein [Austropuccinia psidii MF-1]
MSHILTYHSIQNVQLCHHHVGKGIGPYEPAPARAHAHTPALADAHAHANAPAVLCGRLYQLHPQNDNPAEAESFHG